MTLTGTEILIWFLAGIGKATRFGGGKILIPASIRKYLGDDML